MKRLMVQVEPDLFTKFNEVVPHGFRKHLMKSLVQLAVDAIERDGEMMLGALISKEYKLVRDEAPARPS